MCVDGSSQIYVASLHILLSIRKVTFSRILINDGVKSKDILPFWGFVQRAVQSCENNERSKCNLSRRAFE